MSITITPQTKDRWNKAVEKSKTEKPKIRILPGHGKFEVSGSKGDCYRVTWAAPKGGDVTVGCSCQAGKKNTPCYHIPPTASIFKQQVAASKSEANDEIDEHRLKRFKPLPSERNLAFFGVFRSVDDYCETIAVAPSDYQLDLRGCILCICFDARGRSWEASLHWSRLRACRKTTALNNFFAAVKTDEERIHLFTLLSGFSIL